MTADTPIRRPVETQAACGLCIAFAAACLAWRGYALIEGARLRTEIDGPWGLLHVPVIAASLVTLTGWLDLRWLLAVIASFMTPLLGLTICFSVVILDVTPDWLLFGIVAAMHIVIAVRLFAGDFETYSRWYAARHRENDLS